MAMDEKKTVCGYYSVGIYIIKMDIDTNTEIYPTTKNIVDKNHALYACDCNMALVNKIYTKTNNEEINSIRSEKGHIYEKDKYVRHNKSAPFYDRDMMIPIYVTEETAFFHKCEIPLNYTGRFKQWDDAGRLIKNCNYIDGQKNGTCTETREKTFKNDKIYLIHTQCTYDKDRLVGQYQARFENDFIYKQCYYNNGIKEGINIKFHDNGILHKKCYYKNGKKEGRCKVYYKNGMLHKRYIFINGMKEGLYEIWDNYEKNISECVCIHNIKLNQSYDIDEYTHQKEMITSYFKKVLENENDFEYLLSLLSTTLFDNEYNVEKPRLLLFNGTHKDFDPMIMLLKKTCEINKKYIDRIKFVEIDGKINKINFDVDTSAIPLIILHCDNIDNIEGGEDYHVIDRLESKLEIINIKNLDNITGKDKSEYVWENATKLTDADMYFYRMLVLHWIQIKKKSINDISVPLLVPTQSMKVSKEKFIEHMKRDIYDEFIEYVYDVDNQDDLCVNDALRCIFLNNSQNNDTYYNKLYAGFREWYILCEKAIPMPKKSEFMINVKKKLTNNTFIFL